MRRFSTPTITANMPMRTPIIFIFLSLRSSSAFASALRIGVDAYVSTIRLCNSVRETFLIFSVILFPSLFSAHWLRRGAMNAYVCAVVLHRHLISLIITALCRGFARPALVSANAANERSPEGTFARFDCYGAGCRAMFLQSNHLIRRVMALTIVCCARISALYF